MRIRVECYAGYRGEETPRRFWLGGNRIEVAEILDCWLAPDHRYFKAYGADKATYILRHDIRLDHWEMTFYRSADLEADEGIRFGAGYQ